MIAGITAAVLGFFVVAALVARLIFGDMFGGGDDGGKPIGNASTLNLMTYRENANSLRGNVYSVGGRVEETLRWTPDRGRLISFEANDSTMSIPVPILVPESFSNINIERGSELDLVVRVDRDGTLVAEAIEQ